MISALESQSSPSLPAVLDRQTLVTAFCVDDIPSRAGYQIEIQIAKWKFDSIRPKPARTPR